MSHAVFWQATSVSQDTKLMLGEILYHTVVSLAFEEVCTPNASG